jgi:hypothetical protein
MLRGCLLYALERKYFPRTGGREVDRHASKERTVALRRSLPLGASTITGGVSYRLRSSGLSRRRARCRC